MLSITALPPIEIALHDLLPVGLELLRHLGIAVTREVGDTALFVDIEDHDLLGPPRRLAGAGQGFLFRQRVDGAGLSGVRPAGERDLVTGIGRQLLQVVRAYDITRRAVGVVCSRPGCHVSACIAGTQPSKPR